MKTIQIGRHAITIREAGTGTPVVLLHCTGGSGNQWRGVIDALAADPLAVGPDLRGLRLIMPDLHGYGASESWLGTEPMRLADDAAIVHALAEEAGEPVHLVGHSYGGAVALAAALEKPASLSSLTLIEPVAFALLRGGDALDAELFAEITDVGDRIAGSLVDGDRDTALERFVDYWSGPGAWRSMPAEAQGSLGRRVGAIARNFAATTGAVADLPALSRLTVPTLLLRGSQTRAIARRIVERLMWTLPHVTLRSIEGAGHMAPLTHPTPVARAIGHHVTGRQRAVVRFLERCAA